MTLPPPVCKSHNGPSESHKVGSMVVGLVAASFAISWFQSPPPHRLLEFGFASPQLAATVSHTRLAGCLVGEPVGGNLVNDVGN